MRGDFGKEFNDAHSITLTQRTLNNAHSRHSRTRTQGHAFKDAHSRTRTQGRALKDVHSRMRTQGCALKDLL